MLVVFSAFLLRAAVRHVPCPCFGATATEQVGPAAIARNGALLAVAVLATADTAGAHAGSALVAAVVIGAVLAFLVAASAHGAPGR
jgi:hypothetical protein